MTNDFDELKDITRKTSEMLFGGEGEKKEQAAGSFIPFILQSCQKRSWASVRQFRTRGPAKRVATGRTRPV